MNSNIFRISNSQEIVCYQHTKTLMETFYSLLIRNQITIHLYPHYIMNANWNTNNNFYGPISILVMITPNNRSHITYLMTNLLVKVKNSYSIESQSILASILHLTHSINRSKLKLVYYHLTSEPIYLKSSNYQIPTPQVSKSILYQGSISGIPIRKILSKSPMIPSNLQWKLISMKVRSTKLIVLLNIPLDIGPNLWLPYPNVSLANLNWCK